MRGGIEELREAHIERDQKTDKRYNGDFPKTEEEWGALLLEWKDELVDIVLKYAGSKIGREDFDLAVSEKRYNDCWRILQSTWGSAPDNICIHENPGWNVLCDLCSEYGSWDNH